MLYIYFENSVFLEICKELLQCLKLNGIVAVLTSEIKKDNFLDLYIIFGMNDFTSPIIPNNYIVYQLEQTTGNDESQWFNDNYLNYMKNALSIWDYSLINYQNLTKQGFKKIEYVPIQYMSTVKKIKHHCFEKKDIDIFFYGSFNDRRLKILKQLEQKGLNVVYKNNIWDDERKDLIERSKIILNIHYFENSILETVRLSYLLSNNCFIISEVGKDPILDRWHQSYVVLSEYDQLVETCCRYIDNYDLIQSFQQKLEKYSLEPYSSKIPYDKIKQLYGYLIELSVNSNNLDDLDNLDNLDSGIADEVKKNMLPVDNNDLFEAEFEITKNKEMVLKLPKYEYSQLPNVSIITITYNRANIFPMAIRNWELFEYPREKLEWIIIDDSDDGNNLSDILPKSKQIKYFKLKTTGRLSIGQKRNFGVKQSKYNYISFMDDDDYYLPVSIYARIALLLKYPQYDLVGVTDLDIYDIVNDFSARITHRPFVSEASMAFRKSFWKERPFIEKFHTLGEGYGFLKGRRNRVIKMPSCFNLIAITHWNNYTIGRSHSMFQHVERKGNILATLDLSSRLFIYSLFDKIKFNEEKKNKVNQSKK